MRTLNAVLLALALSAAARAAVHTPIDAQTLLNWLTKPAPFDFLLIDVREVGEDPDSAIATDSCKPYKLPYNSGVFAAKMGKIPKSSYVVLYCRSGTRAGIAASLLDGAGFEHVYSLKIGIPSWTGPKMGPGVFKDTSGLPEPSRRSPSSMVSTPISRPTPSAGPSSLGAQSRAVTLSGRRTGQVGSRPVVSVDAHGVRQASASMLAAP